MTTPALRPVSPTPRAGDDGAGLVWSDLDRRAVDTARVLAMDAVEAAGNGHPGTAMSLAPLAYLLYQRVMRHDPAHDLWPARDRFVLSCGHSSLTQYTQLFYSGYGLELEDLRRFRQWASRTPGHPEYGHTRGVETTTGPLGQGVATAVGMAMAAQRYHAVYTPDAAWGEGLFDHTVWVIASDGDIQEGLSGEASSLAGHHRLGNLVVIWDDNRISIDGGTELSFSEDVVARYAAYGWHTQRVDDAEDVHALHAALVAARAETDRPSFIAMRSVIAWPAPTKQNTAASHGAALGAAEVAATKVVLGFDPEQSFVVEPDVLAHVRQVRHRGAAQYSDWLDELGDWERANPALAAQRDRVWARQLPAEVPDVLPTFPPGKAVATRKASGITLNALTPIMPELWGGSADLSESNGTVLAGQGVFLPPESGVPGATRAGRTIHFGIREHAMGAILNGIALSGGHRVFGGTFLQFADYMRPSIRLAALMAVPATYVFTHDSIGLGEDGPTHQPIEHLAALRAIPHLAVARPADANETAAVWAEVLRRYEGPVAIALTRQDVPVFDRDGEGLGAASLTGRGAYVLAEAEGGAPQVLLIGTGSEVQLALGARAQLQAEGIPTRVVSMPCQEWFAQEPDDYQESVLPDSVTARVSVEAGVTMGWSAYLGPYGVSVGIDDTFGASASAKVLFERLGITVEAVVAAAHESLRRATAR